MKKPKSTKLLDKIVDVVLAHKPKKAKKPRKKKRSFA